jgi:hypothetical protein
VPDAWLWDTIPRVVLAIMLGWSALGKLHSLAQFTVDLRPVVGRFARALATGTPTVEALIALGLLVPGEVAVHAESAAALFLLAATGFIAWRLVVSPETDCGCWGPSRRTSRFAETATQPEQHFVADMALLPWFAVRNGSLLILAVIDPGTCTVRCVDHIFVALLLPSLILVVGLGAAIIRGWLLLRLPEQPLLAWFRARTKHILSISASPRG